MTRLEMSKQEAVEIFGSARKLAESLGISEAAVSQWNDDMIPELRAFQIKAILAARQSAGEQ
jgi:DNA-binding transcriptional regulator YdaS (Cro superfamily)